MSLVRPLLDDLKKRGVLAECVPSREWKNRMMFGVEDRFFLEDELFHIKGFSVTPSKKEICIGLYYTSSDEKSSVIEARKEKLRRYVKDLGYEDWDVTINLIYECYIATAVLGTPYSTRLNKIREVRGHFKKHSLLIKISSEEYRKTAPKIAEIVRNNSYLKKLVLDGLVKPLEDFSEAYQTEDCREKLLKYARSLPFVAGFFGSLVVSRALSSLRKNL